MKRPLTTLKELQQRHIILLPRGGKHISMWSPGMRVPWRLRRAISRYRREILTMIQRSEIWVCPSPELHRHSWGWQLCRECCDTCARLIKEVKAVDTPNRAA